MTEEEDRISLLPDCLLLEIISRLELSTKQVIKTTSTISKRWQHLWTKLPTLVFVYYDDVTFPWRYDFTDYCSFIDKTLNQCPTDVKLNKFKLIVTSKRELNRSQFYSWIRHAITRNVQEVNLLTRYVRSEEFFSYDDELFFNNSCIMNMKLSTCVFNPPNGAIRWDKLKCLHIDFGTLDVDSIGNILSGSPCLETLELNSFSLFGRIPKSLFGNFGVLERLSCDLKTYERFRNDDELFLDDAYSVSMKLTRCVINPRNRVVRWDKLHLCISGELTEDSIEKILSTSPFLETLKLKKCSRLRRIDVTSNSVKNLVLSNYRNTRPWERYYVDTLKINAPYILSLTIEGDMYLKDLLMENVSSLVNANLNFCVAYSFEEEQLGRDSDDIKEELLRKLLSSLGHVYEIELGDNNCLRALSRLEAKGFQFRKGSDLISSGGFLGSYRNFSLIRE